MRRGVDREFSFCFFLSYTPFWAATASHGQRDYSAPAGDLLWDWTISLRLSPLLQEYTGIISISPQPYFSKISSFFPLQKWGKAAASTEDLLYQPSPKHRSFQWGVSLVLHSALAQEPPAPSALTWSQGKSSPKAALGSEQGWEQGQQEQGGCDGRAPGSLSQPVPQGSDLGCSDKAGAQKLSLVFPLPADEWPRVLFADF